MKKIISLIVALMTLVVPIGITAEAASGDSADVMPAFNYISDAGCTLYITESGKATYNSNINGNYQEVIKIEVYVRFQKYSGLTWKTITTDSVVAYDDFACCEGVYYVTSSGKYRTKTTFTVYTADDQESVDGLSAVITYSS